MSSSTNDAGWRLPSANKVGMVSLIAAESAIFVIFIVAYVFYLGKDTSGPTPSVLSPPIFLSVCLLSSSATIELALRALGRGRARRFTGWWLATFALGAAFLTGTGLEWRHLIVHEGLTIGTNLFGTTYYSLVGLHALHVTIGLILIGVVGLFALLGRVTGRYHGKLELIGMYWHFVDTVWVVVFTLVYVVGALTMDMHLDPSSPPPATESVEVPAPTAWPIVCALGVALLSAALATSAVMGAIGAALALAGVVGWWRQVVPHSAHERLPVIAEGAVVATSRPTIEAVPDLAGQVRASLPLEVYPLSAGVVGGIVGGIAMAVLAVIYGVASGHGPWYPVNLLAAGFLPSATMARMSTFYPEAFVIALAIHALTSVLVGALYGALLAMLPRRPILLGGLVAPLAWSGLLYMGLTLINPMLAELIDWRWFVLSQLAFGVVAGLVVARRARIATLQPLPWRVRAGFEATGLHHGSPGKEGDHHA